ncbi:PepSY-like domain-containing protein [uncultured Draconibacterium sp.]|uniref:PepSY-like domain-containing protein n=1 Tax=uncultured Draconibacterium sp. TaxID=1573823 RepID=UPI0032179857
MKQNIVLLLILFLAANTFAQSISKNDIPAVVINSFQLKYPNADDVKWKKKNSNYLVDFKVNSKLNNLILDFKGNVLKHSQDLYVSEVPEAVQEAIRNKLAYFDMHDADRYEEGGKITYEIRFKKDGKNNYFWTDEKGTLLKYRRELNNDEIPLAIVNLITNKYGEFDIDRSKYVEENGKNIYIIRGTIHDRDHVFNVDDKVKLISHYKDLQNDEIPDPVLKAIAEFYKGFSIRDADLVEDGNRTFYILNLRKANEQFYVRFNENGKILEVK